MPDEPADAFDDSDDGDDLTPEPAREFDRAALRPTFAPPSSPPEPASRAAAREPGAEPTALEALSASDPAASPLVALASRWERAFAHRAPLELREITLPLTINADDWTRDFSVSELEVPFELGEDLKELTPQAVLRDLYRPETQFWVELERQEGTINIGGVLDEELTAVRAARHLEPRPVWEPINALIGEEQRRRRALMTEPWQPVLSDDAPRESRFHARGDD